MKTQGAVVMMVKVADLKWFELLELELPVGEGGGQKISEKLLQLAGTRACWAAPLHSTHPRPIAQK